LQIKTADNLTLFNITGSSFEFSYTLFYRNYLIFMRLELLIQKYRMELALIMFLGENGLHARFLRKR